MQRAVVVFSGGQDSTTCLIQALQQYQQIYSLTFDYGQRHRREIEVAAQLAKEFGVEHKVLAVGLLDELTISSLICAALPVPTFASESIPDSFVPGRNILFLTLAAIYAYQVGADHIITGVCETDFSNYPDCRAQFIRSLQQTINLGLDKEIAIETPLMRLTKAETWALADYYQKLEMVRHYTLTCYNGIIGDGCGSCIACQLRNSGLQYYLRHREAVMAVMKRKKGLESAIS